MTRPRDKISFSKSLFFLYLFVCQNDTEFQLVSALHVLISGGGNDVPAIFQHDSSLQQRSVLATRDM
jgi:hypothetical protein